MASQAGFQIYADSFSSASQWENSIFKYRFENHFSKNRLDNAEKIVVKAAKTNGKQLEGPIFVSEEDKNEDAPKKNACGDFLAMFGDIWNVISGENSQGFLALENFNSKIDI